LERGFLLCFFFQAEDGIRDFHVTGVQTCALPICPKRDELHGARVWRACGPRMLGPRAYGGVTAKGRRYRLGGDLRRGGGPVVPRSEERRVGKEWRSRAWPDLVTKKSGLGSESE